MKFRSVLRVLILLWIMLALGACSSITGGRKVDYKSATRHSNLEVPPDLTRMPSGGAGDGVTTWSDYAAEQSVQQSSRGSPILPAYARVELVRKYDERWLVVSAKPVKVWPQLREFVFGLGLSIARENRFVGIIETDWAENRAGTPSGFFAKLFRDTGMRDRYRLRIEEGRKRNTTQVHLTHQGLEEVVVSGGGDDITQTMWRRRPSDRELEAEVLRMLMVHLGVEDAKARRMLLAGLVRDRAKLEFDNEGVGRITTVDPFANVWHRTRNALDRMGIDVRKKMRNKGVYEIELIDIEKQDKKPGLFAKMFGKKKTKADIARVKLVARGKGVEIRLHPERGNRELTTPVARAFMKRLHQELL